MSFSARRVSYLPSYFDIEMPAGATVHLAIRMKPAVVRLGTVVINGESRDLDLQKEGFYSRARAGHGRHVEPAEVEKWRGGGRTSTLLRTVPGVRVVGDARSYTVLLRSGATMCVPSLVVDGALLPAGTGTISIDDIMPMRMVKAVEVYSRAWEVPQRFRGGPDACGALVFWTGPEPPAEPEQRAQRR